jgi:UDP-glucose 4-epimerase
MTMTSQNFFAGKRVLVTGGLGFIGSNLALSLHRLGARVSVLDALIPQHGGDLHNVDECASQLRIEIGDVTDVSKLVPLVKEQEYIFHLAGQMSHGDSMRNPELDLTVNCLATLRLVEACRAHNPDAILINTSTRQVYGKPLHLPVTEQHPIDPIDVNGINKVAAEYYHILYHRVYGVRSVVLRLTNTYGPRQQISNERQGVAGVFIHRALKGLPLQLFGGGEQLRDFNHVDDVVEALLLAASTPECYGNTYNLGSNKPYSLREYTSFLSELCGVEAQAVAFPADRKVIDIGDYYGSYERFRRATGWNPRVDLKEGLTRSVEFFRAHRERYVI